MDTLRGVAALAVLVFHLSNYFLNASILQHGYLAVDFFFILSGFVVAHSYENALRSNLSWSRFVVKRLVRLYPLVLLGVLMGLAVMLVKWRYYPGKAGDLPEILVSNVLNGAMLPTIFQNATPDHAMFPGDDPLWSIFFEMLINLVWAAIGIRMRNRQLAAFIAVSFVAIILVSLQSHTLNIGSKLEDIPGGIARVCFGFPLGALMCRMKGKIWRPVLPFNAVILSIALLAVLAAPFNVNPAGTINSVPWWDLISILILLPAITLLGIVPSLGGAHRLGGLLGALSYPVYIVHAPLIVIAEGLRQSKLGWVNPYLFAASVFIVSLVAGYLALKLYDEPIREWLSRNIRGQIRRNVVVS